MFDWFFDLFRDELLPDLMVEPFGLGGDGFGADVSGDAVWRESYCDGGAPGDADF